MTQAFAGLNLKKSDSVFSGKSGEADDLKHYPLRRLPFNADAGLKDDQLSRAETMSSFTDCSPEPRFLSDDAEFRPITLFSFLNSSFGQLAETDSCHPELTFQPFIKVQDFAAPRNPLALHSQRSCQFGAERRAQQLSNSERAPKTADSSPVIYSDPIQPYYENIERHFQTCKRHNKAKKNPLAGQEQISKADRVALFDWLFSVFAQHRMKPRTIFLAANFFDRFLAAGPLAKAELRLAGLTCLFLASKYEDVYPPSLARMAQHLKESGATAILDMESRIIFALNFNFHTTLLIDVAEIVFKTAEVKSVRVMETTYDVLYAFLFHHFSDRFDLFKLAHFAIHLASELSKDCAAATESPKSLKAVDIWYFHRKYQKTLLAMDQAQIGTLLNFRNHLQGFYRSEHCA